MESGIYSVESGIHDTLGLPYMGRFVEDHVQQVSTSIKETLRDLYLLRHARDFKFYMSQAQFSFFGGVITDVSCISIFIRFFDL